MKSHSQENASGLPGCILASPCHRKTSRSSEQCDGQGLYIQTTSELAGLTLSSSVTSNRSVKVTEFRSPSSSYHGGGRGDVERESVVRDFRHRLAITRCYTNKPSAYFAKFNNLPWSSASRWWFRWACFATQQQFSAAEGSAITRNKCLKLSPCGNPLHKPDYSRIRDGFWLPSSPTNSREKSSYTWTSSPSSRIFPIFQ